MAHKPRREVDIFWDFGSCPAPTDASGYTVANQIRTLALRIGIIKSFKAYLSISDHNSNGRALTLRSELQCSGVSLTDAPGTKDIADKMLIIDMLAHAFDSNSQDDGKIIMLIAGDASLSYLLSILRMRNHRVVVLGPGGGPEDCNNNSAPLASQANLWLDWNTEVMEGITPRSTSTGATSTSRTTENLNSTSHSTKSESPSDTSRENPVNVIAEAASTSTGATSTSRTTGNLSSTSDSTKSESPSDTRENLVNVTAETASTSTGATSTSRTTENLNSTSDSTKSESPSDTSRENLVNVIAEAASTSTGATSTSRTTENLNSTSDSAKSESPSDTSRKNLVNVIAEAASARAQAGKDHEAGSSRESTTDQQPTGRSTSTLQEPIKLKRPCGTTLSWSELASKFAKASTDDPAMNSKSTPTSDKGGAQNPPKPQAQPVGATLSWSELASKFAKANTEDPAINSKSTATSDKGATQNPPKPQAQPAATVWNTTSDDTSSAQSTQLRASGNPLGWAPESTSLSTSTWDDWPPSQTAPDSSSLWNNKPSGNPPEYSPSASGWTSTSTKAAPVASSTSTAVPPEFKNLVGCLRLSAANGVPKPLYGVIAFELIKLDPKTYTKVGARRFSQYVAMAAEKGIVTIGGKHRVEWVTLHRNFS